MSLEMSRSFPRNVAILCLGLSHNQYWGVPTNLAWMIRSPLPEPGLSCNNESIDVWGCMEATMGIVRRNRIGKYMSLEVPLLFLLGCFLRWETTLAPRRWLCPLCFLVNSILLWRSMLVTVKKPHEISRVACWVTFSQIIRLKLTTRKGTSTNKYRSTSSCSAFHKIQFSLHPKASKTDSPSKRRGLHTMIVTDQASNFKKWPRRNLMLVTNHTKISKMMAGNFWICPRRNWGHFWTSPSRNLRHFWTSP